MDNLLNFGVPLENDLIIDLTSAQAGRLIGYRGSNINELRKKI